MDGPYQTWLQPVRASLPKSKNGCVTCRRRHVKCTEEKPTCNRCQKADRTCEYATEQQRPAKKVHIRFKQCIVGPSKSISSPRFSNEAERLGFECFWRRSAESLGPSLGWSEWGRVVLQFSEQDTTVRHAMIGLGALHDHHYQTRGFHQKADKPLLLDFSYNQYGKAIQQLRDRIQSLDSLSPTAAMLVCTLFAIFDFLHGDDQAAAAHLKAGVTMLRDFVAGTDALDCPTLSEDGQDSCRSVQMGTLQGHTRKLQKSFVKAFSYLDFFSLWWSDGEALLPEVTLIEELCLGSSEISGKDMRSLLRHYFGLEKRVHQFLRIAKARSRTNRAVISAPAFSKAKTKLLEELLASFSQFGTIYSEENDEQNRRGQLVLKLNYENLRIMLLACSDDGTINYESFDLAFETIVASASMLGNEITPTMVQFQSFSFSHGLIYPLYIAGTCCSNVTICERAISSLKSFRWSEGVWNGQIMAKIAQRKLYARLGGTVPSGSSPTR